MESIYENYRSASFTHARLRYFTGFIGGFKEYSSIIGIFGEKMGPPGAMTSYPLDTMVGYIYRMLETGYAGDSSAAALILFGIIFLVTMVNLYVSKKKTHY